MHRLHLTARAKTAALALIAGLVLLAGLPAAALQAQVAAPQVRITEYSLPTPDSSPGGLTVGPDGALWFHLSTANTIGRITTDGAVTEYPIPTPNSSVPRQGFVAAGPDGAIWFTENAETGNKVGRITMAGQITEYPLPTPDSRPLGIVAGPDGAMWATLRRVPTNTIARIAMDGTVTEYPVPTPDAGLIRITAGPDGALWFAEFQGNKIGRSSVAGQITEYAIPAAPPLDTPAGQLMTSGPLQVAVGPDGALWFTEFNANQIGRLTLDGRFAEYPVPTPNGRPYQIVAGPDGALWFTEIAGNKIGRLALVATPGMPSTGGGGAPGRAVTPGARWIPVALLVALGAVALRRRRGWRLGRRA